MTDFLPTTPFEWALFAWSFWYLYVLVTGFYRVHLKGELKGVMLVLALPAVVIGYFVDVFANFTLAAIIFLDVPHELLVTSRLQRYLKGDTSSWRYKIAKVICEKALDPFDPRGKHC